MTHKILIHPGLYNSGIGHWQTIWENSLPNTLRVPQTNWDEPDRKDWVASLHSAIAETQEPILLAAHSLGCLTVAWWAATHGEHRYVEKIKGALLVALPDVEQADFPKFVSGYAPVPRNKLPFKTIVVASSNDPWCTSIARAANLASDWGAQFYDIGPRGHINGDSGLGDWQQGQQWLTEMVKTTD